MFELSVTPYSFLIALDVESHSFGTGSITPLEIFPKDHSVNLT